ncbi:hypothetical protein RHGRI_000033 [Rhododendron griersonianum]|uniref:Uncharacterized protein n=1 Tax=Rhododendron griersonianum TaxID=479676 RepID=A0AAV6LEZ9_9ERIC|nr:hypothetical protein RHGRI_000033 [Rhododendron griersonianum]
MLSLIQELSLSPLPLLFLMYRMSLVFVSIYYLYKNYAMTLSALFSFFLLFAYFRT